MTYGRNTLVLRDQFKKFTDNKEELKKDLEEYITAPQFSLDLRWQMFLDAPDELSNHEPWLYHGLDLIITGQEYDSDWINCITDERHEKIHLIELVDEQFSKLKDYGLEEFSGANDVEFLTRVKEQILKDNIKSFENDW